MIQEYTIDRDYICIPVSELKKEKQRCQDLLETKAKTDPQKYYIRGQKELLEKLILLFDK